MWRGDCPGCKIEPCHVFCDYMETYDGTDESAEIVQLMIDDCRMYEQAKDYEENRMDDLTRGCILIAQERSRQVDVEGWDSMHDDGHEEEELAEAAACYALPARSRSLDCLEEPHLWPWPNGWKPEDRIRELVKAGALIAAEIDRLLREKEND